jgi:hypothetical protein
MLDLAAISGIVGRLIAYMGYTHYSIEHGHSSQSWMCVEFYYHAASHNTAVIPGKTA